MPINMHIYLTHCCLYLCVIIEPTTGLDSTAAYSIVKYLVQVAKATKVAVLMTIHQPSAMVFDMLDDLLLLADGKVVYNGSIQKASSYFTSVGYTNPEGINPAGMYCAIYMCTTYTAYCIFKKYTMIYYTYCLTYTHAYIDMLYLVCRLLSRGRTE